MGLVLGLAERAKGFLNIFNHDMTQANNGVQKPDIYKGFLSCVFFSFSHDCLLIMKIGNTPGGEGTLWILLARVCTRFSPVRICKWGFITPGGKSRFIIPNDFFPLKYFLSWGMENLMKCQKNTLS